jgi:hypothetical protein
MALFYFNLVSPDGYEVDEIGSEFSSVEQAFLEAHAAAVEMSAEMMRDRRDPTRCQFEIVDSQHRFLIDLPFSEVIRPRVVSAAHAETRSKIQVALRHGCRLRGEIKTELESSKSALAACRTTLARSRSGQAQGD